MTTLADRMELYMMNRPHGRMILASVEKGPLVWPSITEDGVTRLKEYVELTPAEAIQADYLWEMIKLLMQGMSLTKQERECKRLDEFDKFNYKKGESLYEYYLRFTCLLNDLNIYKDAIGRLSNLHTTIVDQLMLIATTRRHANEVRLMHERNSDPLALVASHQLTQSAYQSHPHTYPNSQPQHHASPYQSSQFKGDDPIDAINHMMSFLTAVVTSRYPTTNNQLRTSSNPHQQATIYDGKVTVQPVQGRQTTYDAGTTRKYTPGASGSNTRKQRTVIYYNCKGEGHIAKQCTKPKRKRDETWFNDKVLLFQAQASGQVLTEEEIAFFCRIQDFLTPQTLDCLYPSMLLIKPMHLVAYDSDCDNSTQLRCSHGESFRNGYMHSLRSTEIVQNSNSSAQQDVLILSMFEQLNTQVMHYTNVNLEYKSANKALTTELDRYKEEVKDLKEMQNVENSFSGSNEQYAEIVRLKQTLFEQVQEKDSLMKTVSDLKKDLKMEENINIDREIALEKKIKQLDNIIFKRGQSAQTVHMMTKSKICYDHSTKQAIGFEKPFYLKKVRESKPKLYDGNVILKMDDVVILDSKETLMLCEESRSKIILDKKQDPNGL
ncbi:integrase, catalytic region, zinc finger, CCHC-type containing protein [Tanacetum coccineum]